MFYFRTPNPKLMLLMMMTAKKYLYFIGFEHDFSFPSHAWALWRKGGVFTENLSLSLQEDIKQTHLLPGPIPSALPQLSLPSTLHLRTPIPHYTQARTKHINENTQCPIPHYTQPRTEQWEIAASKQERCCGVMGGNVGVSSGIDEVLFQRLSLEQGRCALAV